MNFFVLKRNAYMIMPYDEFRHESHNMLISPFGLSGHYNDKIVFWHLEWINDPKELLCMHTMYKNATLYSIKNTINLEDYFEKLLGE